MARIVVDANKSTFSLNLKELFSYRDLFLILAYRDLRVRYAQTFLGLVWAIVQPLLTVVIFTLVFGHFVKVDTGSLPYPVFALCGMVAWTYFSFVMNQSGSSIIGAQEMVKKIYFPRLVIPLSKAVVGLVDFCIALVLLLMLILFYDVSVSLNILMLPFFYYPYHSFCFGCRDMAERVKYQVQGFSTCNPLPCSGRVICNAYRISRRGCDRNFIGCRCFSFLPQSDDRNSGGFPMVDPRLWDLA